MSSPPPSDLPGPVDRDGLIGYLARHPVACNLLMTIMLLVGAWSLTRLNTQFFPSFDIEAIAVAVKWTGASAEDVEAAITEPIERELLGIGEVKEMISTSSRGSARISLEYEEGTDMDVALDQVKERVAAVRNLPAPAEEPVITRALNYEAVARLLVVGSERSSNSRRLVEVVRDIKGTPAYLVDTVADLDLEWFVNTKRVGITAGASTPARVTREVIEFVEAYEPAIAVQ